MKKTWYKSRVLYDTKVLTKDIKDKIMLKNY